MSQQPIKSKAKMKGTYGQARLPVARSYVLPPGRRRALWIGAALAMLAAGWLLVDFFYRDAHLISTGELSSGHALLENNCGACHDAFDTVQNERCETCHEKLGDEIGTYSFTAHYLYRSGDFENVETSAHEVPCATCHGEHGGRDADLTTVSNGQCQACHFDSFDDDHPQFSFAANDEPDRSGITFAHIEHIAELMDQEALDDVEQACLYCHNAQPDGRNFEPISFDRHCDACHLTIGTATPRLPIQGSDSGSLGVLSLEAIREQGGVGTRWSWFANPNELQTVGSRIRKSPLHHLDPWVLHNLRRLRTRLLPDAGLADLLTATPNVPEHEVKNLYREALATLEEQAVGLRGRPEPAIQEELERITSMIESLGRRIEDPLVDLDETDFLLALDSSDAHVTGEQAEAIHALVDSLTGPCQQCHEVENATIVRVQDDQQTLRHAEFDHHAHILQARCLDCHNEIPIEQAIAEGAEIDPAEDQASIQNLPKLEVCQDCHSDRRAVNDCVTCHVFHPDKDRSNQMLLYTSAGAG